MTLRSIFPRRHRATGLFMVAVCLASFGCEASSPPSSWSAPTTVDAPPTREDGAAPKKDEEASVAATPAPDAAAVASEETVYVRVDDGGLALRAGPSVDAKMLLVVPNGAHLVVTGAAVEGYSPVRYFELTGWVHTEFLDTVDRGGVVLDTPVIAQNPELNRGCEVTSLAMLLAFAGQPVDKMTLAAEVDKVPFDAGGGLRGNPNDGFVGDIYTFANPGYGVYHGPVAKLARRYLPDRVVDLTGSSIDTLFARLDQNEPVWIVVNAVFHELSASQFQTWQTSSGKIDVTMQEHSVLVVGYDSHSVFVNDPLDPAEKAKPVGREDFRAAWEQMGRQAIVIEP